MRQTDSTLPRSQHFTLERLADGVYAAIATADGSAFSNAGIIDLGDQTLVFDTFDSPQAAGDLRVAAETLTGRPVTYVIISHVHADHWCGNQVFAVDVPIITSHAIRQGMPAASDWLRELRENPAELEQAIRESQERLETEGDECQRASLELSIRRMGQRLAMLPGLELRLPNQTFSGTLVFHGARRSAELREVAPAHTENDVYLELREDRLTFMGDLGFFQCQPFMADCDPRAWVAQLEVMEGFESEVFVPGHGPLGTGADIEAQKEYINLVQEMIAQAIEEGLSPEEVLQKSLPAPFDTWLLAGMLRWEINVHSMYEQLSGNPKK